MYMMPMIHFYASRGNIEELTKELDKTTADNKKIDINMKEERGGFTLIHYAAWRGHLEIVQLLIERGADLYIKDDGGDTPFFKAVSWAMKTNDEATLSNYYKVFEILLRREAELRRTFRDLPLLMNTPNDIGLTPLIWLKRGKNVKILEALQKIISQIEKEEKEFDKQKTVAQSTEPKPVLLGTAAPDIPPGLTNRRSYVVQEAAASTPSVTPSRQISPRSFWKSFLAFFTSEDSSEEQQHLVPPSQKHSPSTQRIKVN